MGNRLTACCSCLAPPSATGVRKRITTAQARLAYQRCEAQCFYCASSIAPFERRVNRWEVDHVQPVKAHGANHSNNYVAACHSCNAIKKARPVAEFLRAQHLHSRRCMHVVMEGQAQYYCRTRFADLGQRFCERHRHVPMIEPHF